jgi:hypothetical protein
VRLIPWTLHSGSEQLYIHVYTYISIYLYISIPKYIYIYAAVSKRKPKAQAIFLNPFTGCSLCKRKFVVCPFVYEEINGSYILQTD